MHRSTSGMIYIVLFISSQAWDVAGGFVRPQICIFLNYILCNWFFWRACWLWACWDETSPDLGLLAMDLLPSRVSPPHPWFCSGTGFLHFLSLSRMWLSNLISSFYFHPCIVYHPSVQPHYSIVFCALCHAASFFFFSCQCSAAFLLYDKPYHKHYNAAEINRIRGGLQPTGLDSESAPGL